MSSLTNYGVTSNYSYMGSTKDARLLACVSFPVQEKHTRSHFSSVYLQGFEAEHHKILQKKKSNKFYENITGKYHTPFI